MQNNGGGMYPNKKNNFTYHCVRPARTNQVSNRNSGSLRNAGSQLLLK